MQDFEHWLERYEEQLRGFPLALPQEFRQATVAVQRLLAGPPLEQWAQQGVSLAHYSPRSWEAAAEYFRTSPQMLAVLSFPAFCDWVRCGYTLADQSPYLAAAYFRASPGCAGLLQHDEVEAWALLGARLYKGTWKSTALAALFFTQSPALLRSLQLRQIEMLVAVIEMVAERSPELASACLDMAPVVLDSLAAADRELFLTFARVLAEASWGDTRLYFEKGPSLLERIDPAHRAAFLELASWVARDIGRQAYPLFSESIHALGLLEPSHHGELIRLAMELVQGSAVAAMEFLKNAPTVLTKIRPEDIQRWHDVGRHTLEVSREGGEAYFKLESSKAELVIEELSSRVELSRVGEILRLYCKALTGTNLSLQPVSALARKGIGWVSEERPSTEGTTVYLPAYVEESREKTENFNVYKVYATHQAGHLEFGSFLFQFQKEGTVFPSLRLEREQQRPRPQVPLTDIQRFFDLFKDRELIADLFMIVEDGRIDAAIKREYGGIRAAFRAVQGHELERRPAVRTLPLREALIENLIRVTLDGTETVVWPRQLRDILVKAVSLLKGPQAPGATVEDSAEAALRLYDLISTLPNLPPELFEGDWEEIEDLEGMLMPAESIGTDVDTTESAMPEGEPEPYERPQNVDFRGDFKPELVQLLMRLRADKESGGDQGEQVPLSPEQVQQLLQNSVEIDVAELDENDLTAMIGLFMMNLQKEAEQQAPNKQREPREGQPGPSNNEESLPLEPRYFYYDEWDFRAADYKPRWCRVGERPQAEGQPDFFERVLHEHAGLVSQTRKQFEMLRPEMFRKIKRLYDGEDLDMDEVIDFVVQRKAGVSPPDKLYWRRNKLDRDVAVAFLLDMSASTDEEIEKRRPNYEAPSFHDDPRRYFAWVAERRAQAKAAPPKRIIDLEKESIVLLVTALEAIGDSYGIYGFSGYGRDNVEFYIIKDLNEPFDEVVKRRIDKIAPIRSTRMGPAIRHATWKLENYDAKEKILFLISDGRPQDHGYGRDRTEKEYAIHDTKMALTEAKRKGIIPFALTVDKEGHDYLKVMCDDIGYEVVANIEALPSRLPTLYRRLTA